ncbi:MAG: hypothetical protein ED559_07705 [Phycisphaera sp.]|nr:MAG: hypothetical protein ED559_07705 [Phycisphaera sp.]
MPIRKLYIIGLHVVILVLAAILLASSIGHQAQSLLTIEPARLAREYKIGEGAQGILRYSLKNVDTNESLASVEVANRRIKSLSLLSGTHPWRWTFGGMMKQENWIL